MFDKLIFFYHILSDLGYESTQCVKLITLIPQHGQQEGQSGETILLLIRMSTSKVISNPFNMTFNMINPKVP